MRYVAALGRAREVQRLANREKIADLVHLHPVGPPSADSLPYTWIYVPVGTCEKIVGASLTPKA
ncbi:MAG: DUF2282 domain-containing protein [Alphaproteobacteria bacterium]|nr:DUF2282 domain-containing protein [Alphaproteobacteria bacterium]